MQTSKKFFIVLSALSLFFIIIILVSLFMITVKSSGIRFLSLKPGIAWNDTKIGSTELENEIVSLTESHPRLLIVLYPWLKKTSLSTGFKDEDQIYYADWGKWNNLQILKIYVDDRVWDKYQIEEKASLMGRFLRLAIGYELGFDELNDSGKYTTFFSKKNSKISLEEYYNF